MPRFEWPWVLLALAILPLLVRRYRRQRHARPAVRFPHAPGVRVPRTARQEWIHLPAVLRIAALAVLIVAVARPHWGARRVRDIKHSLGIQVLVDHSGSMASKDLFFEGKPQTRLDVVKRLTEEFIFGNGGDLKGRPSDMVGLIAFAAYPITLCPLTLTHEQIPPMLHSLQPARGLNNGTAIGDAVALAAARFEKAERESGGQFKSKVIILLTDGENNSGARTVEDAAKLARQWGVRVYAIGIRPVSEGQEYDRLVRYSLDTLARETQGISRVVAEGSGLQAIYAQIDKLEPSEVNVARFVESRDLLLMLVLGALCLVAGEVVISQTWLRRAP
jgi:Ca-activated chloride channel family protein